MTCWISHQSIGRRLTLFLGGFETVPSIIDNGPITF